MKAEYNEINANKIKKVSSVLKLVLLGVILIAIPAVIYFCHPEMIDYFKDMNLLKETLSQYKMMSIFIYIGAQIVQIIICIIPGNALQFASGWLYGFWIGLLLSVIGAALGSAIVYYLARFLGHDAIHLLFGQRKVTEYIDKMNSPKGLIITFIIFLIPGTPKDLCSYVAGLSDIKLKPYLIVSLIARTPGMMGSLLIGQQVGEGSYIGAGIIAAVAVILFVLGIIFRKQVIDFCYKITDKLLYL